MSYYLVKKFIRRIRNGDVINALYLTYYYLFLMLYDLIHSTCFAHSESPQESNTIFSGATGNFPVHPLIIRKFIAMLPKGLTLMDVGCGSGIILFEAYRAGFTRLYGVELSDIAYESAKKNLPDTVDIVKGDAFAYDYSSVDALFFFRPFSGDVLKLFVCDKITPNIKYMICVNTHEIDEDLLRMGFIRHMSYNHILYKNFSGDVWCRNQL